MRQISRSERFQQPLLEDPTVVNNILYRADGAAITLPATAGTLATNPVGASQIANRTRSLFLPASQFQLNYGVPVWTSIVTARLSAWRFSAATDQAVVTQFVMPADWDGLAPTAYIYWRSTVNTASNTVWQALINNFAHGATLEATGETSASAILANTQTYLGIASLGSVTTLTTDGFAYCGIFHDPADANDTDANAVDFLGLRLDYTADS